MTNVCNKCSKQFQSASALKQHLKRKTPCNEVFNCSNCKKIFKTKFMLEKHQPGCAKKNIVKNTPVLTDPNKNLNNDPNKNLGSDELKNDELKNDEPDNRSAQIEEKRNMIKGLDHYVKLLMNFESGQELDKKTLEIIDITVEPLLYYCLRYILKKDGHPESEDIDHLALKIYP